MTMHPLLWLTIHPDTDADRERLDRGLRQLMAEDPTLDVKTNVHASDVTVGALGELQLEILVDRLTREFAIGASVDTPQVAYIEAPVDASGGETPGGGERPVRLEPIMRVEVTVPVEQADDAIRSLSGRRVRFESREDRGVTQIIRALVPLADMLGYAADLRSRTRGRGTYTLAFERYQPVSADADGDGDGGHAIVGAPLRPAPGGGDPAIALPEPDDA